MEATPNRTFTSMEAAYSYAIKNKLKAPKKPPTRGISCLSLVLYGIIGRPYAIMAQ